MARRSKMKRPSGPDETEPTQDEVEQQAPSKTVLKQQATELQQLGLALTKLPSERRAQTEMPEKLREAIEAYIKTRSHEGRRRQLQYVGKLLRGADPEPLQAAVDAFAQGKAADAENLHRVERWRDELIEEDEALTRWMDRFPESDVQHLRSLVRAARKDGAAADPAQRQPKSYRELFQLIRHHLATEA